MRPTMLIALVGVGATLLLLIPDADARRRRRRASFTGGLQIKSTTAGAQVFVDGSEVGSIPIKRVLRLRPGLHAVKVVKPGYTQFIESITIRRGRTKILEVDLFPIAGVLSARTDPAGARVYVDGKFVGKTPITRLNVKPGLHRVRIAKLGYYDVIRKVTATAGKSAALSADLKALPAHLNPLLRKKKKWYDRWWVWAAAAGGLVAIITAIAVPVGLRGRDPVKSFNPDRVFTVP